MRSSADELVEAVEQITANVRTAYAGGNVTTCGPCGCLIRHDEPCPKCRADLVPTYRPELLRGAS